MKKTICIYWTLCAFFSLICLSSCDPDDYDEIGLGFTQSDADINYYLSGRTIDLEYPDGSWNDWNRIELNPETGEVWKKIRVSFYPLDNAIPVTVPNAAEHGLPDDKYRVIGKMRYFADIYEELEWVDVKEYVYAYCDKTGNLLLFPDYNGGDIEVSRLKVVKLDKVGSDVIMLDGVTFDKEVESPW